MTAPGERERVPVWDPLVRVFHWTLVAAFALAYATEDDQMNLHAWAGYAVLALVLVRILWGFIGTRHARFADFVYPWPQVRDYLAALWVLRPPRHLGHNPAGGWMILALLAALLLTVASGLAAWGAGEGAGPLAGLLAGAPHWLAEGLGEIHEFLADFTLALIAIHVGGVIVNSLLHGENLIHAMITGFKRAR